MSRRLRASRTFNGFLKLTFGAWLVARYRLRGRNLSLFDSISPPYLVLPNHVCFWDPFFVGYFVPDPIYFVTSDRQFRNRAVRTLLGLVGAIPKSKAISDVETVKSIFEVRKKGGVIGVFAEGRRNWDGHSLPPLFATAKLAKALRIPVVVPIIQGAFLALPRWSRKRRKGPVTVDFRLGLSVEELSRLSVDEVHQRISGLLLYDESDYQRKHMNRYRSRRRADGLNLALFVCQSCSAIGALETDRHVLRCRACGCTVTYTEYGFFGGGRFGTIREWNLWQIDRIEKYFAERRSDANDEPLYSDGPAWMLTGYKRETMRRSAYGSLTLYPERLLFDSRRDGTFEFPISEITGVNIQTEERMEFYHRDRLYSFRFRDEVSGYKWMVSINLLKGIDVFLVDPTAV